MNKKFKSIGIFLIGILVGALIMGICMKPNYSPSDLDNNSEELIDPSVEGDEVVDTPNESDKNEVEENDPIDEGALTTLLNAWDSETIYTGGEEVVFNGKIYKAKWWTQNEEPGKADVWEDTLISAEDTLEDMEETTPEEPEKNLPPLIKNENFKVVGYFPSWKENTDTIQYDVLTHINYAFAIPTSDGKLLPLENEEIAKKIIKDAHEKGVRVFIAVGGWSYHDVPLESTFVSATETESKRASLVKAIMDMVNQYGFDGVDMDWEHPRTDGNSKKQYEALMVELAKQLHSQNKELSSAVLSGATADGNIYYDAAAHSDKVLESVDWINVMAYDGGDGERHSSYEFAVNCGKYWHDKRKLASEKVVLGVPFYARPSWAAYGDILKTVPDAWKSDRVSYNGMEVWYNGISTIEKKTNYALNNLGGIMIWEVSQDSKGEYSLQRTIGKTIMAKQES